MLLLKIKLAINQSRLPEAESRQILPEFWFITHAKNNTRMEYKYDKEFRTSLKFSHFIVIIMSEDGKPG